MSESESSTPPNRPTGPSNSSSSDSLKMTLYHSHLSIIKLVFSYQTKLLIGNTVCSVHVFFQSSSSRFLRRARMKFFTAFISIKFCIWPFSSELKFFFRNLQTQNQYILESKYFCLGYHTYSL